jgi:DNA-binding NarL/FixJ family response regulator
MRHDTPLKVPAACCSLECSRRTSLWQAPVALTRREQEVATLVAQGMTNHQMAAKLFLSERTIEKHVSKILRKLDLASRTEIAAWATQKRLLFPNPE